MDMQHTQLYRPGLLPSSEKPLERSCCRRASIDICTIYWYVERIPGMELLRKLVRYISQLVSSGTVQTAMLHLRLYQACV